MSVFRTAGSPPREYRVESDPIDVTSLHRPDTSWRVVDANGHEHRWFDGKSPAGAYDPRVRYSVPTLRWVVDEKGLDEDGYDYVRGHHECAQCGERIEPGYTADVSRRFIPGLRRCYIDGELVDEATFKAAAIADGLIPDE